MIKQSNNRFLQFHLLTAVVLLIHIAYLIPILVDAQACAQRKLTIEVYAAASLYLLIVTVIVEVLQRKMSEKVLKTLGALAICVAGAIVQQQVRTLTREFLIRSNERNAYNTCYDFAEAQELYHGQSSSSGGERHFSQHLYGADSESLLGCGLIDTAFACAEANPGPELPYKGYLFKILKAQGEHARLGVKNYFSDGSNNIMTQGCALVAYPAEFSVTGRTTFIVNLDSIPFGKNLGPNTKQIVADLTQFNPDESWLLLCGGRDTFP
jgi:hypothetical protein